MQRDPFELMNGSESAPKPMFGVPAPAPKPVCIPPVKKPFFYRAEHGVFILPRARGKSTLLRKAA